MDHLNLYLPKQQRIAKANRARKSRQTRVLGTALILLTTTKKGPRRPPSLSTRHRLLKTVFGHLNIYLSDLPEMLNIALTTDVTLKERPTNCLLYADDLVIFARSAKGLQRILNKLESFCVKVDLNVILDKTIVMIFNNSGKSK